MKTIIISDTHLTHIFQRKKFAILKRIISEADRVIINGDFWDYYLSDWEAFLKSEWSKLFPILKSKKTIYLFGNHDRKNFSDDRTSLFSDIQVEEMELEIGKHKFHIEHGDRIAPHLEMIFPILKNKFMITLAYIFELIVVNTIGKSYFRIFKGMNDLMREWAKLKLDKKTILVCGHSHYQEFNLKENFINTGLIRYGIVQYLEIDGDRIEPKFESY